MHLCVIMGLMLLLYIRILLFGCTLRDLRICRKAKYALFAWASLLRISGSSFPSLDNFTPRQGKSVTCSRLSSPIVIFFRYLAERVCDKTFVLSNKRLLLVLPCSVYSPGLHISFLALSLTVLLYLCHLRMLIGGRIFYSNCLLV